MSSRPEVEHGLGRGREHRTVGELGLLDPRALPARSLEVLENYRHSAAFVRTSSPLASFESEADFRVIHGFPTVTGFDAMTVAFWVKWLNTGTQNVAAAGVMGAGDATSTGHWGVQWGSPTSISGLNFWIRASATAANRALSPNIAANTWVHIVGTYDRLGGSPTISGFTNADSTGWSTGTFSTAFTPEGEVPFGIGRNIYDSPAAASYGNQRLFNVMYWNRKLSLAEITAVYNGGSPHPAMTPSLASGLRLWWRPGAGYQERQRLAISPRGFGTIYDFSGNGFHGWARSLATSVVYPTFEEDTP